MQTISIPVKETNSSEILLRVAHEIAYFCTYFSNYIFICLRQ